MPVYEYYQLAGPCVMGQISIKRHALNEPPMIRCPEMRRPVKKLISSQHPLTQNRRSPELRDWLYQAGPPDDGSMKT